MTEDEEEDLLSISLSLTGYLSRFPFNTKWDMALSLSPSRPRVIFFPIFFRRLSLFKKNMLVKSKE